MRKYSGRIRKRGRLVVGPGAELLSAGKKQKQALILGEQETRMAKPKMLKMVKTMLTNKAVGE